MFKTKLGPQSRRGAALAVVLAALAASAPALASTWCGENGHVRLSFTPAPDLQSVTTVAPGAGGTTLVDVWAVLEGVEPMQRDGEAFLALGAFELRLLIEGGEGVVVTTDFPFKALNIGKDPGSCVVGIQPSARLANGATPLVHWQVMFAKPPKEVVLRLDPAGLPSCATVEGCPDSGTFAIYNGTVDSGQFTDLFGAGCAPAYLNWPQAPAAKVLHGSSAWGDVGVYKAAAKGK